MNIYPKFHPNQSKKLYNKENMFNINKYIQ